MSGVIRPEHKRTVQSGISRTDLLAISFLAFLVAFGAVRVDTQEQQFEKSSAIVMAP